MEITRDTAQRRPQNGLLSAGYLDPRELGPNSSVRDLARAYLQELRDKGRGDTPRVRDLDVRILKAYASHLTRRRLLAGRDAGKRPISAASKNMHLIALRGLLKFGAVLDLSVPGPEKVE